MGELLLELLSEEIPARMQRRAIDDLVGLVRGKLAAADLPAQSLRGYVTSRRLALVAEGIPPRQPERREERRGPRVGAPAQAIEGFLRAAGLAALEECEVRDTGRGEFYFAVTLRPGRPAAAVLPELLHQAIAELPWPKSMRFPASALRWVRPLSSVLCLFDGAVVALPLDQVPVGRTTRGHRFLSEGEIAVADAADYREKLEAAHVVLDPDRRRELIAAGLDRLAAAEGLRVKPDPALLDEVTGLVEFPVVLTGHIDDASMALPPEVLATAMKTHQKYFSCLNADGTPAPRFLFVANNLTPDDGETIVAGNERVLKARLADARFFWDQDRKVPLAARVEALKERIYHDKLGTMYDKAERLKKLAAYLAKQLAGQLTVAPAKAGTQGSSVESAALDPRFRGDDGGGLVALAQRAARLSKADLSTGMVGEFPELQGIMGRYYALTFPNAVGREDPRVAAAIADHYKPQGPADTCPSAPVSIIVSLADKLDALAAFYWIGEGPTGSRDPFALRRAALGVIRIVLANRLQLSLAQPLALIAETFGDPDQGVGNALEFITDRLQVHLRSEGVRYDVIKAAFLPTSEKPLEDNLIRLLALVHALTQFVESEDGLNLLIAFRRAANIVEIEARKGGWEEGDVDLSRLVQLEEQRLADRLSEVDRLTSGALQHDDFASAMNSLATLRQPVDEFFDKVTVNASEHELRENRLRLLLRIRQVMNRVADFHQIGRNPQSEERRAA